MKTNPSLPIAKIDALKQEVDLKVQGFREHKKELYQKFEIRNEDSKYPIRVRGEVIDISINYPDDYFGRHAFIDKSSFKAASTA